MRYGISKRKAPAMPNLGKGTECIKLLLSQASKDMHDPLFPMLFSVFGAHISDSKFQYPDNIWKEPTGILPPRRLISFITAYNVLVAVAFVLPTCSFAITVLFCTFSSVTLPTQHLTVFCRGHAAVLPGCDVVGLHFLQLEVLAAVGADAPLPFIGLPLHLLVEQTETEVAQVAREHVLVDAALAFNFVILHQFTDLFLQRIGVTLAAGHKKGAMHLIAFSFEVASERKPQSILQVCITPKCECIAIKDEQDAPIRNILSHIISVRCYFQ